jgi:CHAT domain-containing protein/tetratricopeptide (TPR) repeat protein
VTRSLLVAIVIAVNILAVPAAQDDRRWGARLAEGFQQLAAGKVEAAAAIFDEVAVLARQARDDRSLGEARRGQGRVLAARKDTAGMAAAYADALVLFEGAGDALGIGKVRSDLGFAAWQRADYNGAREEYARAAEVFERAGLKSDHAGALRNMTFGNLPTLEKVRLLERALAIAVDGTDRRLEGLIQHALGDARSGAGDQQAALEHYEAALPLLENQDEPELLARLLTSFGRLHRLHGDAAAAVPYYERTIAMLRPTQDRDAERQAEDAISVALAAVGRYAESVQHAERALVLAQQARPNLVPAQQLRLGEMALRAGDVARALPLLDAPFPVAAIETRRLIARAAALTMSGDLDAALADATAAIHRPEGMDWERRLRAYDARSRVHEQAGRLTEAIADAVQSVRILESVRGGLVTSDEFRAAFSDGYRNLFDRAVELLARDGRHDEAFQTAEGGRARALLDLIGSRTTPVVPPPAAATVTGDTTVAYWVTGRATHAWVVKQHRVILAKRFAIGRREIESLIAKSQALSPAIGHTTVRGQATAMFENDPRPALKQLHDVLFAPLRSALAPAGRLLIVPDGPLLGMSFAELVDRRGRYVIEDYTLQYAPSSNWRASRERSPRNADSALLISISSGYPKAIGITLAPLPGARREVDALTALFPSNATTRVSDADATEAGVREAMKNRGVIHFATHAIASNLHPAESFLALRPGGGHDGRLTAGELLSMSIDADLVVLSACHGASGQVSGEGMLGLSRALLGAGARTLLASVRELPDDTAASMLPRFYRSWRATGDAAAALRVAQLEQLRRLRSGQVRVTTPFGEIAMPEHPALWAGLVLIGDR